MVLRGQYRRKGGRRRRIKFFMGERECIFSVGALLWDSSVLALYFPASFDNNFIFSFHSIMIYFYFSLNLGFVTVVKQQIRKT